MMGKVIMSGIVPQLKAPSVGILASDLAVGSSVYLMENGAPVEYLVVNQGRPSGSTLYDNSCDGTWLLRKDVYVSIEWTNSYDNDYENSAVRDYLNGTFLAMFGEVEQAAIKQAKIPYVRYVYENGVSWTPATGSNGLPAKVFLLSFVEVGFNPTTFAGLVEIDGAKLDYFELGDGASAANKRIAKLDGAEINWWLRSPAINTDMNIWTASSDGYCYSDHVFNYYGVRPALILPSTAVFEEETLILKGVA